MKKQTLGALLLLLGTMIWGVAFVAQTSAADVIGAFTFNAASFANSGTIASVPEPTSGLLMLVGLAGLALRRRRA